MIDTELKDRIYFAKKIFFVGIGGISMSSVAMCAKKMGFDVKGSDRSKTPLTKKLEDAGITVYYGHDGENVKGSDLLVYTAAVDMTNPEMAFASKNGIFAVSRAQFLGYIMTRYKNRIGVSGTHGKSTTAAMLTDIFLEASFDPTVFLGADLDEIGGAYRLGSHDHFIFESCEYKDSFLSFEPDIAIILNIELDHIDYFKSIEDIENSFSKSIQSAGTVIVPSCDPAVKKALEGYDGRIVTFGFSCAEFEAANISKGAKGSEFDVLHNGEKISRISLHEFGEHNIKDALAAFCAAYLSGVETKYIEKGLHAFCGAKRRLEKAGEKNGADYYDDYAHHPTEIKATLSAAREMGYKRVICIFQPHTYTRFEGLLDEFKDAFGGADITLLADIYAAREENIHHISSAVIENGKDIIYLGSFERIFSYLDENVAEGDMVIFMGAGDIYSARKEYLSKNE